jgi:cell division protein FtsQ
MVDAPWLSSEPARRGENRRQRDDARTRAERDSGITSSRRVGDIRRDDRAQRLKKSYRRHAAALFAIVAILVVALVGGVVVYNSSLFSIDNVEVKGVEHLTSSEMAQLANVPEGSTLLRVDTGSIESRLEQNAWVKSASVKRKFPHTLEIDVTERSVLAVVEIPTQSKTSTKNWAISTDNVWLMPIPDENSEAGQATSPQIYADAASVVHIVDVPSSTAATIGAACDDDNVNNALSILSGMTTELAGRVTKISASGSAETTLTLDSGVEVAFGKAERIRDKERVVLAILDQNPGVAYINVRQVDSPTWRSV